MRRLLAFVILASVFFPFGLAAAQERPATQENQQRILDLLQSLATTQHDLAKILEEMQRDRLETKHVMEQRTDALVNAIKAVSDQQDIGRDEWVVPRVWGAGVFVALLGAVGVPFVINKWQQDQRKMTNTKLNEIASKLPGTNGAGG